MDFLYWYAINHSNLFLWNFTFYEKNNNMQSMYYISKMQPQVNDGPRLSSLYFCSGWRGQEDSHYTHYAHCKLLQTLSSL